jgi:hypothetical protein
MNRLHQIPFLAIIGLAILFSCEKDETLPGTGLCDNKYYYYAAADAKIYLKQSSSEIWIAFEQDEVTRELAEAILSKYSFLDVNLMSNNYIQVRVRIKENVTDCTVVNDYLEVLNADDDIYSATPVFYLSGNDPDSYFILISEVLTKNEENLISESAFIQYAETFNLELVEAKYSTQRFRVKVVITGFEALEIANQIYEGGSVQYAHPNFIAKFDLQ